MPPGTPKVEAGEELVQGNDDSLPIPSGSSNGVGCCGEWEFASPEALPGAASAFWGNGELVLHSKGSLVLLPPAPR